MLEPDDGGNEFVDTAHGATDAVAGQMAQGLITAAEGMGEALLDVGAGIASGATALAHGLLAGGADIAAGIDRAISADVDGAAESSWSGHSVDGEGLSLRQEAPSSTPLQGEGAAQEAQSFDPPPELAGLTALAEMANGTDVELDPGELAGLPEHLSSGLLDRDNALAQSAPLSEEDSDLANSSAGTESQGQGVSTDEVRLLDDLRNIRGTP